MKKLLSFLLIAFLYFACKDDKCLKKTGPLIHSSREIQNFDIIYLHDDINLILSDTISNDIIVEAGQNLLHYISTDVKERTLTIANNNTCNWLRDYSTPVNVYLRIPLSSKIFYYGFGSITNTGILTKNNLNIHHYGAGDVSLNIAINYFWCAADNVGLLNLSGTCQQLVIGSYKSGRVDARNLIARNADVFIKGAASNYVNCDSLLNTQITTNANLYLKGDPKINLEATGSGKIIRF